MLYVDMCVCVRLLAHGCVVTVCCVPTSCGACCVGVLLACFRLWLVTCVGLRVRTYVRAYVYACVVRVCMRVSADLCPSNGIHCSARAQLAVADAAACAGEEKDGYPRLMARPINMLHARAHPRTQLSEPQNLLHAYTHTPTRPVM